VLRDLPYPWDESGPRASLHSSRAIGRAEWRVSGAGLNAGAGNPRPAPVLARGQSARRVGRDRGATLSATLDVPMKNKAPSIFASSSLMHRRCAIGPNQCTEWFPQFRSGTESSAAWRQERSDRGKHGRGKKTSQEVSRPRGLRHARPHGWPRYGAQDRSARCWSCLAG
jgi:hypothetical protein